MKRLPPFLADRGRVRRYLSKGIAKAYGYTGYFQIYNLPFDVLANYDYSEKKDIFRPGGINEGPSIFDDLANAGVKHHVSNWRKSEQENIQSLRDAVAFGDIQFAFLYTASLDGLMHDHTKSSTLVDDKLRWYQGQVESLLRLAESRYDEVQFAIFSDHGMCTVEKVVDYMPRVEATGLTFGEDYAAVYDSTMMRFWFLGEGAEETIRNALPDSSDARWISDDEHKAFGTYWPEGRFGDAVYALEPGVLLNPCHMGNVALKGMHGYRPDHPDSFSALASNFVPETSVSNITDLYTLMGEMTSWATQ